MYYTGEDSMRFRMKVQSTALLGALLLGAAVPRLSAEVCTPQSQMKEADRDTLARTAAALATHIASNDTAGLRPLTIADFQSNFSPMENAVSAAAPHVKGAQPQVEQVYLLDASNLSKTPAGGNPDAQFFCTLNQTVNEAEFSIPQLPPGRYAFAMVRMDSPTAPYRLSFLLRQDQVQGQPQWLLAGFYPKPLTAAGHDGLWYWKQARALNAGTGSAKEPWTAWLFYQEAQSLLLPANFVTSTHLDKLQTEMTAAVPPALSGGISPEAPLVIKGVDGTEFRFTALSVDQSLPNDKVDIAAHIKVDALGDAATARKRNVDAMAALLNAHPELRKSFHGVWVFTDAPGQSPYGTELAMAEIK